MSIFIEYMPIVFSVDSVIIRLNKNLSTYVNAVAQTLGKSQQQQTLSYV